MATASAFGISGWDPIGSMGESWLNSAFATNLAKKSNSWSMANLRKQADLQYQYAHQYALNSPSWTVEGLRNAGLNPILAAGNNSPTLPNVSPAQVSIPFNPSQSSGGFDNTAFQAQKLAFRQARANVDLTESQSHATRQNALTNQWQMFDAKSIGAAGFNVQFLGKGVGANGDYKVIHTLRINKVTGEAYDAISGARVRVLGEVPSNSAKQISDDTAKTYNQYNYNYNNYRDYEAIKHFDWKR